MKNLAAKYKNRILNGVKRLSSDKIKEVANFVDFLRSASQTEKFEELMNKTRKSAEKLGYSPKNINQLIQQVRKQK